MKKKNSTTLSLHRETLRILNDPALRDAQAAADASGYPCTGNCQDPTKTEGTQCCY